MKKILYDETSNLEFDDVDEQQLTTFSLLNEDFLFMFLSSKELYEYTKRQFIF